MSTRGFKAQRPRSRSAIERIAQGLRSKMNLLPTAPFPGVELFEALDDFGVIFDGRRIPLNYACRDLPVGVEAQALFNSDEGVIDIIVPEATYFDLEANVPRARFSIAHELGHVYLHTAELLRLASFPHADAALLRGKKFDYPVFYDTEWQADTFAASMLMPGQGLVKLETQRGSLTEQLIQSHFGVSRASAEIRMRMFAEHRSDIVI
jgi:hypothetical protein